MTAELADDVAPNMTILIADDHWVVRESLKQVARGVNEHFVLEEAASFQEALNVLDRNPSIGLLLIDLVMPGFEGFEGLALLRRRYPSIPVVVISIHEDANYVMEAIRHGVIGYIPKSASAEEIRRAIRRVIGGEVSFPREIIARGVNGGSRAAPVPEQTDNDGRLSLLTHREREIMLKLGRGAALIDIATALQISRQTVRVHLGNAMKKLNVTTREAAIHFATEHATKLESMT